VELKLINSKNLDTFLCRFIPRWYVSSWEICGWSPALNFTATTSVDDEVDGTVKTRIYKIPTDATAGFIESGKIQCSIPNALLLDSSSSNATVMS
jgi:hypothetical protein